MSSCSFSLIRIRNYNYFGIIFIYDLFYCSQARDMDEVEHIFRHITDSLLNANEIDFVEQHEKLKDYLKKILENLNSGRHDDVPSTSRTKLKIKDDIDIIEEILKGPEFELSDSKREENEVEEIEIDRIKISEFQLSDSKREETEIGEIEIDRIKGSEKSNREGSEAEEIEIERVKGSELVPKTRLDKTRRRGRGKPRR